MMSILAADSSILNGFEGAALEQQAFWYLEHVKLLIPLYHSIIHMT